MWLRLGASIFINPQKQLGNKMQLSVGAQSAHGGNIHSKLVGLTVSLSGAAAKQFENLGKTHLKHAREVGASLPSDGLWSGRSKTLPSSKMLACYIFHSLPDSIWESPGTLEKNLSDSKQPKKGRQLLILS